MNLERYTELKTLGKIKMVRVDPATVAVSQQKFDPDTGEQLDSQITSINQSSVESLVKQKAILQRQIGEIDAFLEDYAAVPQESRGKLRLKSKQSGRGN